MTTTDTKIELATEAIEALVLATVIAATGTDKDRAMNHKNVVDARGTVAHALREVLAPTLRVVADNRHKDICTRDRCHCGSQ